MSMKAVKGKKKTFPQKPSNYPFSITEETNRTFLS